MRLNVLLSWSQGRIQMAEEQSEERVHPEFDLGQVKTGHYTQLPLRLDIEAIHEPAKWPDLDVEPVDEEGEEEDEHGW